MPKKKILPMKVPKLYNYPIYGFLFSVIEEKDMNWVYSNFIQLMYHEIGVMPRGLKRKRTLLLESVRFLLRFSSHIACRSSSSQVASGGIAAVKILAASPGSLA